MSPAGFLSIPYAISLAGLAVGPPLLAFVAGMSLYCMFLILKCADRLCMKHGREEIGYGDVVELAFKVSFILLPAFLLITFLRSL